MNLQYISDNKGNTTGIYIPIKDWEYLKNKFKELEKEEENMFEVPEWHKDIIRQRLKAYKENPGDTLDWNKAKDKFNLG